MPVELDALEQWGVGQRLLEGVLAGGGAHGLHARRRWRAVPLPPGELARADARGHPAPSSVQLADEAKALGRRPGAWIARRQPRAAGRAHAGRNRHRRVRRHDPRDLLLAGAAARPAARVGEAARAERRATGAAVRIGRDRPGARRVAVGRRHGGANPCARRRLADARRRIALEQLAILLDLYDRGMREPLPLACDTSAAYAQAVAAGADGEAAAREAWETVWRYDKEDREPEHLLVYGESIPAGPSDGRRSARRRARAGMGRGGDDEIRALRAAAVARAARAPRR